MSAKITIKLYNKNDFNSSKVSISGKLIPTKDLTLEQLDSIIDIIQTAKNHFTGKRIIKYLNR